MMLYIIILIDIPLTVLFSILFGMDFISVIIFFISFILNCMIIFSHSIGIQFYRPLFEERSKGVFFNMYIVFFIQVISLLATLLVVIPNFSKPIDSLNISTAFLFIVLVNLAISSSIAGLILYLGIRKLNTIE